MTELNDREFTAALRQLCDDTVAKTGYNPTAFRIMLDKHEGLETVRRLIYKGQQEKNVASGFTKLWELKRLDLSLEAFILREPWHSLLKNEKMQGCLEEAQHRLKKMGYEE